MSRCLINGDIGGFFSEMDVLTIDARRLQIPASGVRGKPRTKELRLPYAQYTNSNFEGVQEDVTPMMVSSGSKREDVVIDIRPKVEPKAIAEVQMSTLALDLPSLAVPLGYCTFCVCLALSNGACRRTLRGENIA